MTILQQWELENLIEREDIVPCVQLIRLRWLGYVPRMEDGRMPKEIVEVIKHLIIASILQDFLFHCSFWKCSMYKRTAAWICTWHGWALGLSNGWSHLDEHPILHLWFVCQMVTTARIPNLHQKLHLHQKLLVHSQSS